MQSPARVVGMHFFNPAPLMPLVEIVRAELSSDEAVEAAYTVGERMGKRPIRCHDTPGFVVNRVLIPLLNDCLRVLDEARVSPEALDTAMTAGAGWPMGPCALVDLVGIDVHVHASEALYEKLREPRMAPPPRIVAMKNAACSAARAGAASTATTEQPTSQVDGEDEASANTLLTRISSPTHSACRYWAVEQCERLPSSLVLRSRPLRHSSALPAPPSRTSASCPSSKVEVSCRSRSAERSRSAHERHPARHRQHSGRPLRRVRRRPQADADAVGPRSVLYRARGFAFGCSAAGIVS